jgi:hypothetical protein
MQSKQAVFSSFVASDSSNPYLVHLAESVLRLLCAPAYLQATRLTWRVGVQSQLRRPQRMQQRMGCSSWRRLQRQQPMSMSCSVRLHASSPRQRRLASSSNSSQALCWTRSSHSLEPGRSAAVADRQMQHPADSQMWHFAACCTRWPHVVLGGMHHLCLAEQQHPSCWGWIVGSCSCITLAMCDNTAGLQHSGAAEVG